MSSDRDFLQLVNEKISVYSPIKKKFYDKDMVLSEYGVTTDNFLTQKILLGDSGDNVPGVRGLGSKTMLKLFPELGSKNEISLDQILEKCKSGDKKLHESIVNYEYQLRINKRLMDLREPNIPLEAEEEVDFLILHPNKELNSQEFINLYNEDNLGNAIANLPNWLFKHFNQIAKYK
jgi:5'-3' exonuclease